MNLVERKSRSGGGSSTSHKSGGKKLRKLRKKVIKYFIYNIFHSLLYPLCFVPINCKFFIISLFQIQP